MVSSFTTFFAGPSRKAITFVALIVLGLGAVAMIAHGQNTPAAPDAQPATGATLTNDQLAQALASYGPNTSTTNGHTDYSITVTRGKWNINLIISLSPNGKVIWMFNSLTSMPDPTKVSAAALANVLAKNTEIGPMFFSIANGSLRLSYPVPNYELTTAGVHADVDALLSTILDTAPLWNPDALAGNTPAAQPDAPSSGNPLAK
jgi:hypothetical protein